ncbi:MAG: FAD-dependent oxidoreductase [Actinomycetaceae bacterium]|nr:FAD-dependent oxidoreductase [Actinomycetaceae bacterium]
MTSRTVDVVVIGGGLAGLSAAYSAIKAGLRPLLLEERGRPGGLVCSGEIGGQSIDIGAESFATRSSAVVDLAHELGLETVSPQGSSWIWTHQNGGRAVPIPHGIFGIPANLDDPLFVQTLTQIAGEDALERAKRDLTMGPSVGAHCEDLASLVSLRMGKAVLDTFVTPFAGGIHAADPKDLAVDSIAPGLRAQIHKTGSLVGAVRAIRPHPTPVVAQTQGGMFRLPETLRTAIINGGGMIESRKRAIALTPGRHSLWKIWAQSTRSNPDPHLPPIEVGDRELIRTSRVIIATPAPQAFSLLGACADAAAIMQDADSFPADLAHDISDILSDFTLPAGAPIAHVTLVLNAPQLDKAPRGSGMLVSPPNRHDRPRLRAKALTHYSAKWPDTILGAPPHTHVLRVSYGRNGEDLSYLTGETARAIALADAATMMGVTLDNTNVIADRLIHWDGSLVPQTPETREKAKRLEDLTKRTSGLSVTGAWVAGSGLAAVIPHGLGSISA